MFGSFLPEPWFGFGTTKSTQVGGADIVMKSQAHAQKHRPRAMTGLLLR
jgi:hypothetical protein